MIVASLEIKIYFVEQGMIFRIWELVAAWVGTALLFFVWWRGVYHNETFTNHISDKMCADG